MVEQEQEPVKKKSTRGFASMDRDRLRQVTSKGGKEAHRRGKAHTWTSAEAQKAGKKGGEKSPTRRIESH